MKVLIGSPAFPPSLGGLERVVEQLALGLTAAGDRVAVVTRTPNPVRDEYPFEVLRNPRPSLRLRAFRECDVFVQANVALKDLWPLLLAPRPWVVWHQGLYPRPGRPGGIRGAAKVALCRLASAQVAASRFVARAIGGECGVVENPYREDLFRELPGVSRDRDLLCVARLVSDKGVDVLLRALGVLARGGLRPRLSVVGSGPEEPRLRELTRELGLESQVEFAGRRDGEDLVLTMNAHRILVVPSTWEEPFGVVALEGLACGCEVVASSGGGLPEAVGPSGLIFPNGDHETLASQLKRALAGETGDDDPSALLEHLARHQTRALVERWQVILRSSRGQS